MNTSLCACETRPFLITLPAIWDTSDPMVQSTQGHGTKHSRSWYKALTVMVQSTHGHGTEHSRSWHKALTVMAQSTRGHGTKHSRSWHRALKVNTHGKRGPLFLVPERPLSSPRTQEIQWYHSMKALSFSIGPYLKSCQTLTTPQ